jgi:hypothetical protein
MKSTIMFAMLLLLLGLPNSAFSQKELANLVRNGDFEKFTGENPDGWETSNIPGTLTVVSASKIYKSGAHAVKCEVKDFYGSLISGFICQKNIPIGGKDVRLSASFMVHSVGKDEAVLVLCYQNAAGSTIGTVEEYIEDTNSKWSEFSREFKSPAGSALVHVRLTLLPGKDVDKAHPGSYVICDDMKLAAIAPVAPVDKPLVQ